MDFITWLETHVLPEKQSARCKVDNQTVALWEKDNNVDMTVFIKDVSDPCVIVDPWEAGQWRLFDGLDGWGKNCDFLILGKSNEELFVLFVELKSSLPHDEGKKQLRWTRPLLHHLLSVFNVANSSELQESDLTVKYFMIGEKYYETLDKRTVKTDAGIHAKVEGYMGITINYRVSDKYSLAQLLRAN